ncbi:MAG TPA: carbohydrate-binding family 9-like protein [Aggregicoccus sp.]|nr:carbohydrate-binding family 9-like protein [Aggregicoccus sp.]
MRSLLLALLLLALAAPACRDEQAGPPPRGVRLPAPASPRVLDAAPADLSFRSGATFAGGTVQYLGSRVAPAAARPGQAVRLSHYFVARAPPPPGWHFFVHVLDAASGEMLLNADHEFQQGAAPLGSWPVGKVMEDVHSLPLPSSAAVVALGFWQGSRRLAVDDARHSVGEDRMAGPPLGGGEPPLPEYRVPRAARAPRIDGSADEPAWKAAPLVTLRGSFDGSPAPLRTQARLLYDDAHLYVSFDVEDPDVWGTHRDRDAPLYEQEVVEIFLDANADGRTYNELQVSAHGVHFDAYFPARRQGMDLGWDSGMQSAVKVRGTLDDASDRDGGWTVELRIPFARLAEVPHVPPRPGDRWRFNLYRLELPDRRSQQGQALSPLYVGDFHALPRFAWLTFE